MTQRTRRAAHRVRQCSRQHSLNEGFAQSHVVHTLNNYIHSQCQRLQSESRDECTWARLGLGLWLHITTGC